MQVPSREPFCRVKPQSQSTLSLIQWDLLPHLQATEVPSCLTMDGSPCLEGAGGNRPAGF